MDVKISSFKKEFSIIVEKIAVAVPVKRPVDSLLALVLSLHPQDWVNQSIINGKERATTTML
jgi:hypothetical protein